MREILLVAKAHNVRLSTTPWIQALTSLDGLPDNAMSSMQRDIMAHRPSELESSKRSGRVATWARSWIETPANSFLYASLLPLENAGSWRTALS